MADESKKCAHTLCSCTVTDDKYCSQACEDAADVTSLACDCAHAGCAGHSV